MVNYYMWNEVLRLSLSLSTLLLCVTLVNREVKGRKRPIHIAVLLSVLAFASILTTSDALVSAVDDALLGMFVLATYLFTMAALNAAAARSRAGDDNRHSV